MKSQQQKDSSANSSDRQSARRIAGNGPVSKAVLLAVLAHPDDESFGTGGTLALYAQRGVAVHLVCATRGEAGEVDQELMEGYTTIADRRIAELRCAVGILGLSGVYFLDYRDSGMPGSLDNQHPRALVVAPTAIVAAQVVHYIRELQPQVVLTFDPIGGYKHPDHIAIHRATVEAFSMAGDNNFIGDLPPYRPQKLYYHVMPKGMMRVGVHLMRLFGRDPHRFGRNGDIDLAALVEEGDFPVHASIDYHSVRDRKDAAAACHSSQLGGGPPRQGLFNLVLRWFNRREQFMRAYPPITTGRKENDLFAGVKF